MEQLTREVYKAKITKVVLTMFASSIIIGAITLTALKYFNVYVNMQWPGVIAFNVAVLIELGLFSVVFYKIKKDQCMNENLYIRIKYYCLIAEIINFNILIYTVPSKEIWVIIFYFLILYALFLDFKLIVVCILLHSISLGIV